MVEFSSAEKWSILAHEDEYPEISRIIKARNTFNFYDNKDEVDKNVMG